MLKTRILTALVLVPLIVVSLFQLSSLALALVLGAVVLAAAWEWAALCGVQRRPFRLLYLAVLALGGVAVFFAPPLLGVGVGVAWWLWALLELIYFKDIGRGVFASRAGKLASGILILVPAWLASYHLHLADPLRPAALLFLFVLVWVADSAAYFAGKTWGRTKLAPHVSPGKTLEGVAGALVAVLALAYAAGVWVWQFESRDMWVWLMIAAATTLFSVLGDLVESRAKRLAGVKDSGALLPGHGGVFDRIDAFTAAAPVFAFGAITLARVVP